MTTDRTFLISSVSLILAVGTFASNTATFASAVLVEVALVAAAATFLIMGVAALLERCPMTTLAPLFVELGIATTLTPFLVGLGIATMLAPLLVRLGISLTRTISSLLFGFTLMTSIKSFLFAITFDGPCGSYTGCKQHNCCHEEYRGKLPHDY
jgi:hypothetical protein